jgi:Flp pilus assembly protein TadG
MKRIKKFIQRKKETKEEKGQSIVLIALMMVAIIAFVGIAIDVGFIFARGSQLQSAIDSAALAGVVELSNWSTVNTAPESDALTKSAQFLNANNMPVSVTNSINIASNIDVTTTPLGATEYAVTATWPVETYFLKVLGFREPINLTRSATAAIFSLADIYVSRRVEDGVLSTSNQGIFGPDICINYGDPYSPRNSPFAPGLFAYTYRIYIPPDYADDVVRVELFDPDSINTAANTLTINRSQIAINNSLGAVDSKTCGSNGGSSNRKNPCLLRTDEMTLVDGAPNLDLDQVNPFWFVRIDENRGAGSAPGNGNCGSPSSYNEEFNTQTRYSLYYFAQNADGTIVNQPLVTYFGQTGTEAVDDMTDLRWVSPGATVPFSTVDAPPVANVPVSAQGADSFEIDLTSDVPNIVVDQSTGARYIYMDVETQSGASENGFEIWAGPPTYVNSVPSEVNARNLYVLNNVGSHSSKGVTVFGMGNLPMNSNFNNAVDIPLLYVGPEMIGQVINVSLFDSDAGAQPPIVFYFDSIGFTPANTSLGYDPNATDWAMAFGVAGQDDPDGIAEGVRCRPGSCQSNGSVGTGWVDPPYQITVPGNLDNCDYDNPTMADCTPFVGGRLVARYIGGQADTYGWQISIVGLPYIVK